MVNKRGEAQIGTIIAIVLGVAALAFLLFGFSAGWGNLWDKIVNVGGGSSNFGTIKQSCEVACSSQDKDNYCTFKRTVKFAGETQNVVLEDGSCAGSSVTGVKAGRSCSSTCSKLSQISNDAMKGFPSCPAITCDTVPAP